MSLQSCAAVDDKTCYPERVEFLLLGLGELVMQDMPGRTLGNRTLKIGVISTPAV